MRVLVRPAALADLRSACDYYERERPGLSADLVDDADRLFARLEAFPRSAPVVVGYDPVRRATLRRFPCAVFFLPGSEALEILRIVHTARSPDAWRE